MEIYKPNVVDFETPQYLYKQAQDLLVDKILDTLTEESVFRMALSGGKTPLPLYQELAKNPIVNWDRLEIYQTDERCVDSGSIESNQFHFRQAFEDIIPVIKEFNMFDMDLEIDETVNIYSQKIEALEEPFFDLTILGVGRDGHIASLFPKGEYLKHLPNRVLKTVAPTEFAVAKRLSLSIETILNSKEILILVTGSEKIATVQELLDGKLSASEFPAKFLLAHPKLTIYQSLNY